MESSKAIDQALFAMAAAWEEGCPVAQPSEQKARIAIRRWSSSKRRGINESDRAARVRDLAKGLIQHGERDPKLVGPLAVDYEYLACMIAGAIEPEQSR